MKIRIHFVLEFSLVLFALARTALAADYAWKGDSNVTNNWGNSANWTPSGIPDGSADTVLFTQVVSKVVTVDVSRTLSSLIFSNNTSSGYLITTNAGSSSTLTIAAGGSIICKDTADIHNGYPQREEINCPMSLSGDLTLGSAQYDHGYGNFTLRLNGTVTGSGTITYIGPREAWLNGNNNQLFTGSILVTNGNLYAGSQYGFGSNTAVTLTGPGVLGVAGGTTTYLSLTVSSNAAAQLWAMGNNAVVNGPIALQTGCVLTNWSKWGGNTWSLSLNGPITGSGTLVAQAGTDIRLIGTSANTFTGDVKLVQSTLILNKTAGVDAIPGNVTIGDGDAANHILQLSAANQINDAGMVVFGSQSDGANALYSCFRLNGQNETVGGLLSLSNNFGTVENNHATTASTLTVTNNADCIFAGMMRNGGAAVLNIEKAGTGIFYMNGIATNTGTFTVRGGTLGGTGTIAGVVMVTNSAAVNPGTNSMLAGTLTINNTLTLATNSVLNLELGQPGIAGSGQNDLLSVAGNLTLAGTLNITNLSGFESANIGSNWVLVTYGGTLTTNQYQLGTLPVIIPGATYSIDTNTAGQVRLKVDNISVPPAMPTYIAPTNGSIDVPAQTNLSWNLAAGANGYNIYLWTTPGSPPGTPTASTPGLSWDPPGDLIPVTNYSWYVAASNANGSTTGATWLFTTALLVPAEPVSPSPANGAVNVSIATLLDWDDTARADGYEVYFWLSTDSKPGTPNAMPATSVWDPPGYLADGSNYSWQVVDSNGYGSITGSVWTFTTKVPQVFTWDGGGVDNNWTSPLNWTNDASYPDSVNDTAIITGTVQPAINLNGNKSLRTLIFTNTTVAMSVTNSTLTLAAGGQLVNCVNNWPNGGTWTVGSALNLQGDAYISFVKQDGNGRTFNITGQITGSSTIYIGATGASSVQVSGNNTNFTGSVILTNGTIKVGHSNCFGTTSLGTTLNAGTTLVGPTTPEPFTIAGNAGFTSYGGTPDASGSIVINSGATFTLSTGGNGIRVSGPVSGPGNIILTGGGSGYLSGTTANTYTGSTEIAPTTFTLAKTAGINALPGNILMGTAAGTCTLILGANQQISDTAILTQVNTNIANMSIFRMNSFSETIGGLGGGHTNSFIENNHATTASTLTISNNVNCMYAGKIRNGAAAALNIVKTGSGTWFFNGIATNSGTWTISGGTLGGTGTVSAVTVITNGAAVSPGTNVLCAGTMVFSNDLLFATNAVMYFELGKPGFVGLGTNDLITVASNLTFAGTINVTNLNGFESGGFTGSWVLVTYAGTLTTNQYRLGSLPGVIAGVTYAIDTTSTVGQVILKVTNPHSPYYWSLDQTNVVLQLAGGNTDVIYNVFGIASNLTNAATLLYQTSNTTAFTYINTNALGSVERKFYRVTETLAGVESTNSIIYTAFRKQLDPNSWYKYALGIDYGAFNRLDSTLGSQLAQGLYGSATKSLADLFYLLDSSGNWAMCYLNGSGAWCDYSSDSPTNTSVLPWQSFWIKRRSSGSASSPIYSGYCFSNAAPLTFRSNDWHMITWPLPLDRKEGDGAPQGWGFAAAGGKQGTSWLNSDILTVGDGASLRFYYLYTNGRWCPIGSTTPASGVAFHVGEAYYYMHRGTGFTWTASEP